jgi:hypothetical protein
MPHPGQIALEKAVEWIDEHLGFDPLGQQDPHLVNLLDAARTHRSRRLDDTRLHGAFDELVLIAAPSRQEPIEHLRRSRQLLVRLSAPPYNKWRLIRQGDGGYYALQHAKNCGVTDPDHDPLVIEAYLKQGLSLARQALNYYRIPLETPRRP